MPFAPTYVYLYVLVELMHPHQWVSSFMPHRLPSALSVYVCVRMCI